MLAIRWASTAGGRGVATTGKDQHTRAFIGTGTTSVTRHQVTGTNALHRGLSTIAQEPEVSSCGACDAGLAAGAPMSWRCGFGSVAQVEQHLAHHPDVAKLHQCGEGDGGGEPPIT
jgi:hypothetical protein